MGFEVELSPTGVGRFRCCCRPRLFQIAFEECGHLVKFAVANDVREVGRQLCSVQARQKHPQERVRARNGDWGFDGIHVDTAPTVLSEHTNRPVRQNKFKQTLFIPIAQWARAK